ncbi:uncharacterized protein L203_103734 [Cryptococcus depauperatus CBS 7841]|uniref:Uncharacterized protein n=1 Tax=Cryptococcus depauperatus CBS 7841 TaxID=1295531 RepID=A0A1E3IEH7_9TREE|nr:hypothetical protein L203_03767 [Cryptococcus depauperatus CBS 7841]
MFDLPRVQRYVDDVFIRTPAFYGDHGGPGWYPELQTPTQSRLAVRWNAELGRDVYIQPDALFLTGLDKRLGREDIVETFRRFGLGSRIEIPFFRPHKHLESCNVALVMFPCPRQAEDALIFCNENSCFFGDKWDFRGRFLEINSNGEKAGKCDDILLVREELSLTPAHIPTCVSRDMASSNLALPSSWNAVGYSRDAFAHKRKLADYDLNREYMDERRGSAQYLYNRSCIYDENLSRRDGLDFYEMPSPPKRRFLGPPMPCGVDQDDLQDDPHGYASGTTDSIEVYDSLESYRLPLSPKRRFMEEHHYSFPYPTYTSTDTCDFGKENSLVGPFRHDRNQHSSHHRQYYDRPSRSAAAKVNKVTSVYETMRMSSVSALNHDGLTSHVESSRPLSHSSSFSLLKDETFMVKELCATKRPLSFASNRQQSQIDKSQQDEARILDERRVSVISLPNQIIGEDGEEIKPGEPLALTPLSQTFPFDTDEDSEGHRQPHSEERSVNQSLSNEKKQVSHCLPTLPLCSPRLLRSHVESFSHHFHPRTRQSYTEPRYIAVSPNLQTLSIMRDLDAIPPVRDWCNIWSVDALSEEQKRLIGLEKKWVFTGPAGDVWRESKGSAVVFDSKQVK